MRPHLVFLTASGSVVVAAIAAGVFVIGGPGQARQRHLDVERVQSLERIAGTVDTYYRQRHAMPPSLQALAPIANFPGSTLHDPETGAPYRYEITGPASYRLCAVFARRSEEDEAVRWTHRAGPVCFAQAAGAAPNDDSVVSVPLVKPRP